MSAIVSSSPLIGSLCSGYGGLDLGVQTALGGTLAWHAEVDPNASRVLARHWPGVPNLGDITTVDWSTVPRVCVLTVSFPCQRRLGHAAAGLDSTPRPDRGCGCTSPVRSRPSDPAW